MFVLKSDYRLLMTRIWFLPLLLLSPTLLQNIINAKEENKRLNFMCLFFTGS